MTSYPEVINPKLATSVLLGFIKATTAVGADLG